MPLPVRFVDSDFLAGSPFESASEPPAAEEACEAPREPTRLRQVANFVIFQGAWFAAVLGAAHGWPVGGTAAVVGAMAWHVAVSARPAVESMLLACVCVIGFVAESVVVQLGHVAYPSGQPVAWLPPYWIVALWGLFAIALNVTLRWLKHRPVLALVLGAIAGPLSFVSGVRLGGAQFVDTVPALITLVVTWGLLMPVLMALSNRFDGVVVPAPTYPDTDTRIAAS